MNIIGRPALSASSTVFRAFPLSVGQAVDSPAFQARGRAAISEFDSLLSRTGAIANDGARQEILDWVGKPEVPGTPAERYQVVNSDLAGGTASSAIFGKRVQDLEDAVLGLRPKVAQAESAYGTITGTNQGAIAGAEGALTGKGIFLGVVAILGLVVVPLSLD